MNIKQKKRAQKVLKMYKLTTPYIVNSNCRWQIRVRKVNGSWWYWLYRYSANKCFERNHHLNKTNYALRRKYGKTN